MKSIFIFFVLSLLLTGTCLAQYQMVWSDPVAITDSLTDNVNISMPEFFNTGAGQVFVAWEKSTDANSSSIYVRDILTMSDPVMVLSQPNVHFRNPRIMNYVSGDTLLLIFYETDQNGNWDIYSSKILSNMTAAPAVPICNSPNDEINFKYVDDMGLIWEENGTIYFRNLIIFYPATVVTTVTLDQGNCHKPVLSNYSSAWEKVVGSDTLIMYALYQYPQYLWTLPDQAAGGINKNPYMGGMNSFQLMWQTRENSVWRVRMADLDPLNSGPINDFPGSENIQPCYSNVMIVTKQPELSNPLYYSFASDNSGSYEIYVNEVLWDSTLMNISNHPGQNLHPRFYSSMEYMPGFFSTFLFWESLRGGRWQIWGSHIDMPEGINDKSNPDDLACQNYPNPFHESTLIKFQMAQRTKVSVEIFNVLGTHIRTLREGMAEQGEQTVAWDGKDMKGVPVRPGIYMCSVKTGSREIMHKITVL